MQKTCENMFFLSSFPSLREALEYYFSSFLVFFAMNEDDEDEDEDENEDTLWDPFLVALSRVFTFILACEALFLEF